MAEWQTRKLEVFVGRPVLVQVQLSAPKWYLNRYLFFVQLDLSVFLHTSLFETYQHFRALYSGPRQTLYLVCHPRYMIASYRQVLSSAPKWYLNRYLFLCNWTWVCFCTQVSLRLTSTFVLCTRVPVRHFTLSATQDIWLHHIDKSSYPHQKRTFCKLFFCFSSFM